MRLRNIDEDFIDRLCKIKVKLEKVPLVHFFYHDQEQRSPCYRGVTFRHRTDTFFESWLALFTFQLLNMTGKLTGFT